MSESFIVVFETDIDGGEHIEVKITRAHSPKGTERLHGLVTDGFFDEAVFFRVVPGFVVQFGIAADPTVNEMWSEPLPDEPQQISNTAGTLAFAKSGPNTRTTQLFFNVGDNSEKLDGTGFTPFGEIVGCDCEEDVVELLGSTVDPTDGDAAGVSQEEYETKGNEWLLEEYPKVNTIIRAYIKK